MTHCLYIIYSTDVRSLLANPGERDSRTELSEHSEQIPEREAQILWHNIGF
jgi:hypothetical protein